MNEMAVTADHLIVIGQGRLLADCPMAEFIDCNSKPRVLVKTSKAAQLAQLVSSEDAQVRRNGTDVLTVTGVPAPRIAELAAAARIVVYELTPQRASLEEAFLEMTAGHLEFGAPAHPPTEGPPPASTAGACHDHCNVIRGRPGPLQPAHRACFGRLVRAEWTKIRSVRSTVWSLGILVVTAIGLNTLITAAGMAGWHSLSAATKQGYLAGPTGFLAVALNIAQIPVCVLSAMVITSEYSTGMIRASVLAVPRRSPILAAKAAVFAAVAFVAGTLVAFASFLSAQAIIRSHIPVSLSDPAVLRAVFGMGLYLTVLGLLGLAIGALARQAHRCGTDRGGRRGGGAVQPRPDASWPLASTSPPTCRPTRAC